MCVCTICVFMSTIYYIINMKGTVYTTWLIHCWGIKRHVTWSLWKSHHRKLSLNKPQATSVVLVEGFHLSEIQKKKDRESEVQLFDRRTGSSETGALPQRFGHEPWETGLFPCQFSRPRLEETVLIKRNQQISSRLVLSAVSTLNLETATKDAGPQVCFHLISSPLWLEAVGINWDGKGETGTCLAVQLLRGFWQTFPFPLIMSCFCAEPKCSLWSGVYCAVGSTLVLRLIFNHHNANVNMAIRTKCRLILRWPERLKEIFLNDVNHSS